MKVDPYYQLQNVVNNSSFQKYQVCAIIGRFSVYRGRRMTVGYGDAQTFLRNFRL